VDFKNTVIILTSNVGTTQAAIIEDNPALDDDEKNEMVRKAVMEEVRRSFRPEFLNRLDDIVIFHRLAKSELSKIVDIQLKNLEKRLAKRELGLELSPAAKDFLGEVGWDPQYGARPLKRAIQRYVEDPLAQKVLAGEFAPGDIIAVDRAPGGD